MVAESARRRRRRRHRHRPIPCPYNTYCIAVDSCAALFASRLEIDSPVGGQWGQNSHTDPAEGVKWWSPLKLSPRALHITKSALAASVTLALYGPLLKALDLPFDSPIFAMSSVI